ncbi:phospholipase D delta-like [Dorcoceras hygrometricum]|uniref:Phospholipase D delta-like n=1 Tax=Dorcoceras hygrometricum TaxID=472368 RepID=A0A2Z7A696_9LAMI|nr:phospholipase D delta-like [Dorcoceras hygrometricum]
MVIPQTKKASGFAVQISLLLEGVLDIKLAESKALPSLKILSVKSVGTYIAKKKSSPAKLLKAKKKIEEYEEVTAAARMAEEIEAKAAAAKAKRLAAMHHTTVATVDPTLKRK